MNKKKFVLGISIVVNLILAVIFILVAMGAAKKLRFTYVEKDTIRPDSLRMYLERENYGVAASLSHPIRGGAVVDAEDMDYFLLGEYADLLFLREVFAEAGNEATLQSCDQRLKEIRETIPEYATLFDKIDWSAKNAIPK